jgi:hypothetical protein
MLYRSLEITERRIARSIVLTLCLLLVCGCSTNNATRQDDAQLRAAMTLLGRQYGTFVSEKGAPPPDEATFREYLRSRLSALGDYGVKNIDDLLRNGRDGQPLRLIYGTKVSLPERAEYVWAAHEQIGVAGKRFACDSRGGVHELSDVEYSQQLVGR